MSAVIEATPRAKDLKLVTILYALSGETRLRIVVELAASGEMTCGSCSPDIPRSSLSHHFYVLRNSGPIVTRRKGRTLWNSLRRDDIEACFPGLSNPDLRKLLCASELPRRRRIAIAV
jgi:DNA-binding transcriptional ArsR family regulator